MKYFYIFALLGVFGLPRAACAAPTAKGAVEQLNQGIIEFKKDKEALFRAIKQSFDLERSAVLSVGQQRWKKWSAAQRQAYLDIFTKYIVAIYQNRFKGYEGSGLNIYDVKQKSKRALVYARIKIEADKKTLSDASMVKINFSVYQNKNNWLINDVYFKGTISEVAGFRAQFSQILNEKGYKGLIIELTKKCKSLGDFCRL